MLVNVCVCFVFEGQEVKRLRSCSCLEVGANPLFILLYYGLSFRKEYKGVTITDEEKAELPDPKSVISSKKDFFIFLVSISFISALIFISFLLLTLGFFCFHFCSVFL